MMPTSYAPVDNPKKKKKKRREFESLINLVRIITIERNLGIKLEYSLILYCTVN